MFTFSLPYSEALKLAKKLAHSVGKEETRYYLKGFFVHKNSDGKHYAASTNGHVMTRIEITPTYDADLPFPDAIFPTTALKQLEAFKPMGKDKAGVLFTIDGLAYQLACMGQTAGGTLVDATYPDYQRTIPGGWRDFSNEYGACGISPLYFSQVMKAASYDATSYTTSPSPVRVFFEDHNPAVIVEAKDPSVLYLVMPMRASFPEHRHSAKEAAATAA